jgi:DNA-binding beta-propeller fold protein YncE
MIRHSILAGLALALSSPAAATPPPHYAVSGSIPGPDGGWDLLSIDRDTHRLFVAHGTQVMMVDLGRTPHVTSLGSLARGHAAVPIPGANRVLATSGGDGRARIYSLPAGELTADVAVGRNPDAAIWDGRLAAVLVMNAGDGTVSVVDPVHGTVTRTIQLSPGLELPVLDDRGILFVNNEEANLIHVVDPATGAVGEPIALPGCEGPTGLGYDGRGHRLIAACANGKAAIVDAVARRLIQLVDIGRGPDGAVVDDVRGIAFIPCGRDGELDVIPLRGTGPLAVSERVRTEIGATVRRRGISICPARISVPRPPAAAGRRLCQGRSTSSS